MSCEYLYSQNILLNPISLINPHPYWMFTGPKNQVIEMPTQYGGDILNNKILFNQDGFRQDSRPEIPKPTREFRVLLLGGSALVMGNKLQSLPDLLMIELNKYGNVKIYNYGIVAAVSSQQLALLTLELTRLNPDLIIFYDGYNDFANPLNYDPRIGYPYNFITNEIAFQNVVNQNSSARPITQIAVEILKKDFILRGLYNFKAQDVFSGLNNLRTDVGYGGVDWENEVLSRYRENIDLGCKISLMIGANYLHIMQPSLYYADPSSSNFKKLIGDKNLYTVLYMNRQISKFKNLHFHQSKKCFYEDLSLALRLSPEVFVDSVHLNYDGNLIMSKKIADIIKKNPLILEK